MWYRVRVPYTNLLAGQKIAVPRANDIDVDGAGRLYVASWKNGRFKYDGEDIGYVAMISPPDWKASSVPKFDQMNGDELVGLLR